mmetsp:Transcript_30001/g.54866  ORF Transcript_30001/g.54866 Transcript_30001/m.54866 type:complete len:126 (-) Transcript_30001:214-591(-)
MTFSREVVYKFSKDFYGRARNVYKVALRRVEKSLQHAYVGRKDKKRDMRSLWIMGINAGTKQNDYTYNKFIHGLGQQNIQLNRKSLHDLAVNEPQSFKALVEQVKFMRGTELFQSDSDSQRKLDS